MKPMHATVAIITALAVWNDVMTPLIIMAGTGQNTLPLAQLNFQTQFGTNYNLAFASYLLALLPILIFYVNLPEADYEWCCKRSCKIILKNRRQGRRGLYALLQNGQAPPFSQGGVFSVVSLRFLLH